MEENLVTMNTVTVKSQSYDKIALVTVYESKVTRIYVICFTELTVAISNDDAF